MRFIYLRGPYVIISVCVWAAVARWRSHTVCASATQRSAQFGWELAELGQLGEVDFYDFHYVIYTFSVGKCEKFGHFTM